MKQGLKSKQWYGISKSDLNKSFLQENTKSNLDFSSSEVKYTRKKQIPQYQNYIDIERVI